MKLMWQRERELPNPVLEAHTLKGIPVLTDEALFAQCGVRIAFSGREGGVSGGGYATLNTGGHVGDNLPDVLQNRARLLDALGAPDAALVVPSQVHGTHVVTLSDLVCVDAVSAEAKSGADAVVVAVRDAAALLNFADCLPLIIVSPTGQFAVAHAGWRGAVAHIAAKAARELAEASGAPPASFNAYIGPHIRSECFEVGPEVGEEFAREFGSAVLADERHVDLAAAVSVDLLSAGLSANRIADAGLCTVCNSERYYSYRATGGDCGRHAAVAVAIG